MNRETLDFLTATELTEMEADVADLLDDAQLSRAVTYRDFASVARTLATGAMTPTYGDLSLRAVRSELSAREVAAGAGLYQAGDVRYLFAQSDLTVTPTREDRIVDGPDTYELVRWAAGPVGLTWAVVARRVK